MEVLRPCWAVATSGLPVREQLFNASICHHSPFNLFQHGEFSRNFGRHVEVSSLEVASPILIPRHDGHRHRKGSHGDIVFLTNRGEVCSLLLKLFLSIYIPLITNLKVKIRQAHQKIYLLVLLYKKFGGKFSLFFPLAKGTRVVRY